MVLRNPIASLQPKRETKVDAFLAANPDYDGRGVRVAVLDTGIDPGAVGLARTPSGAPKILDLVDCSGSGDVRLTTVADADVQQTSDSFQFTGLSGRKLTIPSTFVKGQGTWQLGMKRPMNAYKHSQQWSTFSDASLMSYSFNFYDDDILSVVCNAGSHGTHVAGIVAAHHSDPLLNGVAPGAQLISLKIGDSRLGSIETSQSFMRAMNEAIRQKVDIINMSYGEDSHLSNDGPAMQYLRDIVIRKHGITCVISAGNNGPGVSTVGCPGGMTSSVISVGAYVSREMALAQYALRKEEGDLAFTWSSRGPSPDGDKGVTVYAPGGATTCIPPYTLSRAAQYNGTSMSSPHCAGAIALLLSGLKQEKLVATPASIKRALERTAVDVSDEFKVGLLDVQAAYEDLKVNGTDETYFDIQVDGNRGILMRNTEDVHAPRIYQVDIKPFIRETATREKFDFETFLTLQCAAPWVETAKTMHMAYAGRPLQVKVNPQKLGTGLHVTSVDAIWEDKVLFSIPITVIKPEAIQRKMVLESSVESGTIDRHFLAIPAGVTAVKVSVATTDISTPVQLWTAITQFQHNKRRTYTSSQFVQNLTDSAQTADNTKTVGLVQGTAEFCFAQFWSSIADRPAQLKITLEFSGLQGSYGDELSINGGSGYKQIQAMSNLGIEQLKPAVRLSMIRKHLRPSDAAIAPLGERDLLEDASKLFSLTLQYSVSISRDSESQFILPVSGLLYESPFYSNLFAVYDDKKNVVFFGHSYPEKHKFDKGTYTVRVELVHKSKAALEKAKKSIIVVETALEKQISVPIFTSFLNVWDGPQAEFKNTKLAKGQNISIAVANDLGDDTPKEAAAGDILTGDITLGGEIKRPVFYHVAPKPKPEEEDKPPKSMMDRQIEMGASLTDKEEKQSFFDALQKSHPRDLQALGAYLEHGDQTETGKAEQHRVAGVILDVIDANAVAQYFGVQHQVESKEEKQLERDLTRQRDLLLKAHLVQLQAQSGDKEPAAFEQVMRWSKDATPSQKLVLAEYYVSRKLYGLALESLAIKELQGEELAKAKALRVSILEALQFKAWADRFRDDELGRDPKTFAGF
ncbi:subtilase family-domain-containing protein [Protomyces lactucae-debilis]|uniref:tripeptidyl-peptidase II n=1 Tax=Protomyces lactucae-debilis TaxID=2754530 RepID=A0A1Y2EVD1_PROLT|nr:subtilase family-domain-containing protein [Protomyces lactucae-debilis]ORY75467.1 subtilase family-domain-containing protein [Protomyces lactucae-debilis]